MASSQRSGGRRFDHDYGVTTHAVLFLTDLDPDAAGDAAAHATHYEAVPVGDFQRLLALLPSGAIERSTFVDVGAGMGRAMILAAQHPFRQVCGVEISPSLYEIGRENLQIVRDRELRCRDLRLYRSDARIWTYPPGDLVVCVFNPVDAPALRAALASIAGRRPAGATSGIYHTPVERTVVESLPEWTLHAEIRAGVIYTIDAEPERRTGPSRIAQDVPVFLRVDVEQDADGGEIR